MPPSSLAIIIGAGPTSGAGIARVLANPAQGNMAVALLARNATNLNKLAEDLRASSNGGVLHAFPTDTDPSNLSKTFAAISAFPAFEGLKLSLAVYHVKQSSKKPFLEESAEAFGQDLQTFTTGAFAFAQQALRLMYEHHGGQTLLADTQGKKKGTIIFTGTLGALRTNPQFAAYGATRAAARSVAQALAKEHGVYGVQGVHVIANGPIKDVDNEDTRTGKVMSAEAVGKTYLWLAQQEPTLWLHELDIRPAQEKF